MKLVDNWKQSPNWWSIQWQLAMLLASFVVGVLPLFEVYFSPYVYASLMAIGSIATIVFRLMSQTPKPTE